MLEGEDADGKFYLYVDKNTYDQAVLLNSKYQGDVVRLACEFRLSNTEIEKAQAFSVVMPAPICILGPFLSKVNIDFAGDIEKMCGILSQMSMCISFFEYTKMPEAARASLQFNKAYLEGYKDMWIDVASYYCDSVSVDDALVKKIVQAIGAIPDVHDAYSASNREKFESSDEDENGASVESTGKIDFSSLSDLVSEIQDEWAELDIEANKANEEDSEIEQLEEDVEGMSEDDALALFLKKMGG